MSSAVRHPSLRPILKRTWHLLKHPTDRRRYLEVWADLIRTRHMLGRWAAQGAESADPNQLCAILSFTNLPLHAKFHCLIAKTMQRRGYTPVIFTYRGNRFGHEYFRLFGFDRLLVWEDYLESLYFDEAEIDRIARALLPPKPTIAGVLLVRYHGVAVGKHALSVTARRLIEGRPDLDNPRTQSLFQGLLRDSIRGVLAAERFLRKTPVKKMLVRDSGYIPNGPIFETALEKGVDCVVYEQGQRRGTWIFKRYTAESKGQHYFSLSASTWERIQTQPWTSADDQRLDAEFAGRYTPHSTDDTRRLQSGKKIKTPDEVRAQLGLDPGKKTAVIFSHVAWDAAFFFGACLFEDFENWLFQTVKFAAAECPHLNWIVKLHPFNAFKLQREGKTEESEMRLLRSLMPLPPHIILMRADTDINTSALFPLVDYVLTVNGTVGMEFPCFGVPAVLAGTGRYNGKGFTIEPPTVEAYFETLRTLHTLPRLDEASQRKARQHFYTLTARRQTSLEDIAPMQLKRLNEAVSDIHDNITIKARSLVEFDQAQSLRRFGEWFDTSTDPDLLEP
ncbi:MAG: hypothetical protein IT322_05405 [Anaerolineae bacterium]|nr:hypothetical protein [Anaerolineae bacterium]